LEQCRDPSSNSNPEYFLTRHVNFDWTIDFNTKTISGCVAYEMVAFDLSTAPDQMLVFDVKDLEISKVCINETETKWLVTDGPHPQLGSCLKIHLPEQTASFTLHIGYQTSPQSPALQWLDAAITADKQKPFLFTQCQAIHARNLFPCQDTPRVKFTYTATVRADPCMTVLMSAKYCADSTECPSSGNPVHNFEQPIPVPSYLVALVCGDLRSAQIGPRSKVWAEPSVVERAAFEFGEVDQVISAAERICGPYQWGNYDILVLPPSFPFGGMENPCLTFVTPTLLAGDRSLICTIAHEASHSWTGNLVTNASWENFWLNEGHTTYLEGLVLEAMYGLADFKQGHPFTKLVPCLDGVDPDDCFSIIPYQKGSLLLYFLEQKYGKLRLAHVFPLFLFCPPPSHPRYGCLVLLFPRGACSIGKLSGFSCIRPGILSLQVCFPSVSTAQTNYFGFVAAAMLKWLRAYLDHFRGLSLSTRSWLDFLSKQLGPNVLTEVNWDDWFYKTDAIPWVPNFTRKLSTVCDSVVSAITKEDLRSDANVADSVRSTYEGLVSLQRQLVLQRLLERVPFPHDNLRVLDQMFQISQAKNSEIRYRWSLICLRSQYLPGLHSALEFLNSQGRMKFTRPIYKALMSWPSVAEQAISNFKAQRQNMHPTTAKLVAQDLGLA
uniref:Leuk-A4-hydro_C domain-containing protein n=1 Tax=Schistocephalus solidus TaxID=70667 RepID=A0A183T1S7_SCHSO